MRNKIFKNTRLNLDRYLYGLMDEIYCLIKFPKDFPNCRIGGDLDIFCYRIDSFGKRLLEIGERDVRLFNFEIEITKINDDHWHIDFLSKEMIEFRFDLYGSMPKYRNIKVNPALFESVIENSVSLSRTWEESFYNCYIPATVDDMIIRYLEYCEYFKTGPDKIHHLEHIQSLIDGEDLRIGFYEKLHHYIDFPDFDEQRTTKAPHQWPKELVSNSFLKKCIYELGKTPIQKWPSKIARGIRHILY